MKRFALLLLIILPALIHATAGAQTLMTPADYTPWNHLVPSRAPASYQTIIGQSGTNYVSGSATTDAMAAALSFPLPCSIYHLGMLYPAGHQVRASIGGFIGFDPGTNSGFWPYQMMPAGGFYRLIIPFWTDLRTSGGGNQGIFYRLDVDPISYDSTVTIEWSAETMSPPFGSGRFQLRLHQIRINPNDPLTWRTMLSFKYDGNNNLVRSGSLGAVIGLKNQGQACGYPSPISPGIDNDKSLMLVNPGAITPDHKGITRLPTRDVNYTPDWFANTTTTPSAYFHYDFPDSNYSIKPVEIDTYPDYMPPGPSGLNTVGFPVIAINATVTLAAAVGNYGIEDLTDVPVVIRIIRDTTVVLLDTVVIDTLRALSTSPMGIQLSTSTAGTYRLVVTTNTAGDQYRKNDTMLVTYYVTPQYDGITTAIVSPVLVPGAASIRYAEGDPIPINVKLGNSGTMTSTFYAGYTIYDENDSVVASDLDTIGSPSIFPLKEIGHSFGSFTPDVPGRYRISVSCAAAGDQIPSNNVLNSMPKHEWTRHGPSPDAPGMRPMLFEVYPSADLAVSPLPLCMPRDGDTVMGSTRVLGLFFNHGAADVTSATTVRAIIRDAADSIVYNSIRTIPSITGGRGTAMKYFNDFTPESTGEYCIMILVQTDSLDQNRSNDTVRWCFTVITPEEPRSGGGRLSLLHVPRKGSGRARADSASTSLLHVLGKDAILRARGRGTRYVEPRMIVWP